MKLKRLIGSVVAASLALAGCAPAVPLAEVPPPGAVPGPALWALKDEDTTIYLFGTVHALPQDKPWFDERIARAFNAADELVTEINVSDMAASARALAGAGMLAEGQNLREMMSPENRQQFEDTLVGLGLPVEAFDRYEPWFAAITLSLLPLLRAGYEPQSGVEQALSGRSAEKRRAGLESIEEQVALFDQMPVDAQLRFLDQTVESSGKGSAILDAMVAEWIEGDAEQLAALMNAELDDPELYARLLTQRNANWAEWIARRMDQPGTVFIAVGAGHLAGAGSVQRLLAQRGLKVTRVWQ